MRPFRSSTGGGSQLIDIVVEPRVLAVTFVGPLKGAAIALI